METTVKTEPAFHVDVGMEDAVVPGVKNEPDPSQAESDVIGLPDLIETDPSGARSREIRPSGSSQTGRQRTSTENKHYMGFCKYKADSSLQLSTHVMKLHGRIKKYACYGCDYKAGDLKDLVLHTSSAHVSHKMTAVAMPDSRDDCSDDPLQIKQNEVTNANSNDSLHCDPNRSKTRRSKNDPVAAEPNGFDCEYSGLYTSRQSENSFSRATGNNVATNVTDSSNIEFEAYNVETPFPDYTVRRKNSFVSRGESANVHPQIQVQDASPNYPSQYGPDEEMLGDDVTVSDPEGDPLRIELNEVKNETLIDPLQIEVFPCEPVKLKFEEPQKSRDVPSRIVLKQFPDRPYSEDLRLEPSEELQHDNDSSCGFDDVATASSYVEFKAAETRDLKPTVMSVYSLGLNEEQHEPSIPIPSIGLSEVNIEPPTDPLQLNEGEMNYQNCEPSRKTKRTVEKSTHMCKVCCYKDCGESELGKLSRVHKGKETFNCNMCDYFSSNKCHLTMHMRIHTGEKPFKCNICDYAASRKSYLDAHMKVHTGERPFACNKCDYASIRKGDLATHLKVHTGERPFVCSICDYASSRKGDLAAHLKVHTGERPFACSICDYVASRKSHLDAHMNVHTGERPFACNICDYAASRRSNLAAHAKVHTRQRMLPCNNCDYATKRNSHLGTHMVGHPVKRALLDCTVGRKNPSGSEVDSPNVLPNFEVQCASQNYTSQWGPIEVFSMKHVQSENSPLEEILTDDVVMSTPEDHPLQIELNEAKREILNDPLEIEASPCGPVQLKLEESEKSQNELSLSEQLDYSELNEVKIEPPSDPLQSKEGEMNYQDGEPSRNSELNEIRGYRTLKSNIFKDHMNIHTGGLDQRQIMVRHEAVHSGEKPFACYLCNYAAIRKSQLVRHMKKHAGDKSSLGPSQVESNDVTNPTRGFSEVFNGFPMSSPPGKNMTEDVVMRDMKSEPPLQLELRAEPRGPSKILHSTKKPLTYEVCGYETKRKICLNAHLSSHAVEKLYACKFCSKRYLSKSSLSSHKKKHWERYKCNSCDYATKYKWHLRVHQSTHAEIKPISCDLCDFRTTKRAYWGRHVMVCHFGEYPYRC